MKKNDLFRFKSFEITHKLNGQKVSTDSVLLGAWAKVNHAEKILDIGTGCGILALMAAQRNFNAFITAIEKNELFLTEACKNFQSSPFRNRIEGIHSNATDFKGKFDSILCNPPYFRNALLSPDAKRNEARHSEDLDISVLIKKASELLSERGILSLVFPFQYFPMAEEEAGKNKFNLVRICEVRHNQNSNTPSLILAEYSLIKRALEKEELIIKNGNNYSQKYSNLLGEFLLIF